MEHLHGAVDLGKVAVWNHLRGLVANTNLETSRAPVHKLDGLLGLQAGYSTVDFLGHNIATVQETCGHVLARAGIALDHLVARLEARHGDLLNRVGLVAGLDRGNDRGVRDQREVNARVWDQVGLELVEIDVQRAVESKRGSDGRNN